MLTRRRYYAADSLLAITLFCFFTPYLFSLSCCFAIRMLPLDAHFAIDARHYCFFAYAIDLLLAAMP